MSRYRKRRRRNGLPRRFVMELESRKLRENANNQTNTNRFPRFTLPLTHNLKHVSSFPHSDLDSISSILMVESTKNRKKSNFFFFFFSTLYSLYFLFSYFTVSLALRFVVHTQRKLCKHYACISSYTRHYACLSSSNHFVLTETK